MRNAAGSSFAKIKKICFVLLMVFVMLFSFMGCESREEDEDESEALSEGSIWETINSDSSEEEDTSEVSTTPEDTEEVVTEDADTAEEIVVEDASQEENATAKEDTSLDKVTNGKSDNQAGLDDTGTQTRKTIDEVTFIVSASSSLVENVSGVTKDHSPLNLGDNDANTAWVEGATGDGIGEWVQLEGDGLFSLESMQITNGYTGSETLYEKNNRVKKLKITADNGQSKEIELTDGILQTQSVVLNFKDIQSVKIEILEVYEGSKYEDLCISELQFNGISLHLTEN